MATDTSSEAILTKLFARPGQDGPQKVYFTVKENEDESLRISTDPFKSAKGVISINYDPKTNKGEFTLSYQEGNKARNELWFKSSRWQQRVITAKRLTSGSFIDAMILWIRKGQLTFEQFFEVKDC